jgi:hypothetical protein
MYIKKKARMGTHPQEVQGKQGVCHIVDLPFTWKSILREKKNLWKLKYFTMLKHNLQKIL